ncbi:ABC transporter ATP-binding protein [Muricoccus radiodurans]|uniref:ABC transporter ATP-binding protein n=1 Tax=Muricoccus radiodurans TaxID=2231721 RepID=UPI003CEA19DB
MQRDERTALEVEGMRLAYGGVAALDGVSLRVPPGIVTGLIGPNGAGKTTLFNAVTGLARPDAGRVRLFGQEVTGLPPHRLAARGMVRSFQLARGLPAMTVFEHLMLYGPDQAGERLWPALVGGGRAREAELAEKALTVAARLGLSRVIDNRVGALSGGQRKLLEIGRALMASPRLMLLDEPAAGVNPTLAETIGDHLMAVAAEGTTILLVEHDMALVSRVCAHVIVMALGRHLAEGTFDAVRENPDVQDAYLGTRR